MGGVFLLSVVVWESILMSARACDFSSVPVQDNFDASQFTGVWYTNRAKNTRILHSAVRRYSLSQNGDLKFAFTAVHPVYRVCIRPIHQTLREDERPGQYTLHYRTHDATVKIAYTDYSYALAYVCVDPDASGTCDVVMVETMSRVASSVPRNERNRLDQILRSHECVDPSQLRSVNQGSCEPPPPVSRRKRNSGGSCLVNNIAVSSSFSMSDMTGIWYEIARTRFTFNQMESGVFNYIFNSNTQVLTGLYSGTKAGVCQPAFPGQSRKKTLHGPEGDLLARIGGSDSLYPWSPFKILYADANHIMFYACYGLNDDGTCISDKTEVTLVSKSRDVSDEFKQTMANLLTTVCLQPQDLVSSDLEVDCTEVALGAASDSLPDVSGCIVDGIPVQENFDIDSFLGDWKVVGVIEYGQKIHTGRAFVRYTRGSGNYVWESVSHSGRAGCEDPKRYMIKPRCASTRNGNYLTTYGSGMRTQWTSMKILATDYNYAVIYTCTLEKLDGTCDAAGITVRLLTRWTVSEEILVPVLGSVLPSVCASPFDMTQLQETAVECFDNLPQNVPMPDRLCDVERLQIHVNYIDQQRLSGMWYEIARSPDPMLSLQSALIFYRVEENGFLSLRYTGNMQGSTRCVGPIRGTTRPRCIDTINGEYLGRMQMPGQNMWVTWKILYTDYLYTIAFSCINTNEDGTCSPSGIKLHILGQTPYIGIHRWAQLREIVRDACIEPDTLIFVQHTANCTQAVYDSL